jgi:hypothetical protein
MAPKKSSTVEMPVEDAQTRQQAIERRAYEISQSAEAGTPEENWERAERELPVEG